MKIASLFFLLLILTILLSRLKEKGDCSGSGSFSQLLPDGIPQPYYNKVSPAGIRLGRYLFYDPILSDDKKTSCSTCHIQKYAFSDTTALDSIHKLTRNTPPLFNLAWSTSFFWDGGVENLESQTFAPLTGKNEMGINLKRVVKELKGNKIYSTMFEESFPGQEISSALISRAISQFERSLISFNSKYDQYKNRKSVFTEKEIRGLKLFDIRCSMCHKSNYFTDFGYHNNGLDADFSNSGFENEKLGRFRITNMRKDVGKFKTPSLRNIALTGPYMHDGRFKTLQDVLNHYSEGIQSSATLDKTFIDAGGKGLSLNAQDKDAIISFLLCLTDSSFIINPDYSNPFKKTTPSFISF